MSSPELPDWLARQESFEPPRDRLAFLRKSAKALAFVIRSARHVPGQRSFFRFSPPVRLALTFATILFVSASGSFAFVKIVGAALLVVLATYEPKRLARTIAAPLEAFAASAIILAPALFWGQTRAFIVVPVKTLITTTALSMAAGAMNWNRLTCALKSFGVPDSFIFIFDLTLKYVVIFSEKSLETIEAATLRSVGRIRGRARTMGGIAGLTFLRSQEAAQEQFDAMTCRCFSGVYRRYRAPLRKFDVLGGALIVALAVLFFCLK